MKQLTLLLTALFFQSLGGQVFASDSQTVLITGSNRGIGFEFVKQYSDKGYTVIATTRSPDKAEALQALAKDHKNIIIEKLDLVDLDGIDQLANKYEGQPIDILINNGALMRGPDKGQRFGSIDYEMFDLFFHINTRGVLKVTEAFWGNLKASPKGTVASLTTSQGKRGIPAHGFIYYKSSKAAMDNLHYDIARQGKKDKINVIVLQPGRVATHADAKGKHMVPIVDSIAGMINVIEKHDIKNNGNTFRWNAEL
jgi:NAD(P)-dependent dehydrogenase (short-subunit alcohol dehydrogenase family)